MVMAAHHCEWSSCHSIVHVKWFLYILTVSFMSCTFYHNKKEEYLSSLQLLSHVQLFTTPWTAARQASLSITNSWSLLKAMSIESVMPSNHLILCCLHFLLPSIFPSIRVISNESALQSIGVSASTSELPMNIQDWFPLGWTGLIAWQFKGILRVFSNTTVQRHSALAFSLLYSPPLTSIHDHWKNHSLD